MSKILCNFRHEAFRSRPLIETFLTNELPILNIVPIRFKYYHNRHRDPKFRKERGRKMWPVELPDFDYLRKQEKNLSPDEVRTRMKEKGVAPPNPWEEREVYAPCTMGIIEPYVIKEGDGKSTSLLDRMKTPVTMSTEMFKNRRSLGVLRTFEGEDFDLKTFARQSVDIYKKAHEALMAKHNEKIFDYVTEHCFPMMVAGLNRHTIIWKYLDEVEPPQAVQVRVADLMSKANKYSQITVRMHSKQILAVYDRHGRLILGSPTDVKEVLEYIVFEKYLANEYGLWRIHNKIKI